MSGGIEPYYDEGGVTIYLGDCRKVLPLIMIQGVTKGCDAIITDPPYGDTSLDWDRKVDGWLREIPLVPQLWCFGSMRFFLEHGHDFTEEHWKYGQEIVWEKHNGSGFHADRFKRVHEFAVHWYRGEWKKLHLEPITTDGHRRVRATRPRNGTPHTGDVEPSPYDSTIRLERSVLQVRSEHGRAVHPTQKPLGILSPLIRYSVTRGGLVLDPFMGSGSTLLAARQLGRRAIGIEEREDYCEAAVQRLGQGELALSLDTAEMPERAA